MTLIEPKFRDALGHERRISPDTRKRIEAALQRPHDGGGDTGAHVIRQGTRFTIDEPADLVLEDGRRETLPLSRRGTRGWRARVPGDVPLGYHWMERHDTGARQALIVTPARCHLPAGLRIWSWAVQLYSVRSRRSWGMGDFADLARVADWADGLGCRLLLLNPLHAATPTLPQQSSPYSPSTRRYLNPLYVAVEQLPGARDLRNIDRLRAEGARLNDTERIDRDRVFTLKMRALDALYRAFSGDRDFDAFVRLEGASLQEYATFCLLAEEFGANWRRWPARYRTPHGSDVRRFADAHADRVRFHQWVQWHADRQLAGASRRVPVMQDLPIGIDPLGADAWAWQEVLAQGMSVGAPPDEFNTRGQNWGLPPFVPDRLRRAAYRPFIETIRGTMRHAGGLRIDHVMGLYRLFWIPEGMDPAEGAYVRNNAEDLLGIIALESQRAQVIVVGEDLGTVERRAQKDLMAAGVLSYRLLWFEQGDPAAYPAQAMAAVTTHDLPTIAGLWNGSDLEAQRRLGLSPNEAGIQEIRERLARMTRSSGRTPLNEVIVRAHKVLSRAPSTVVSATLEDATATEPRPNMPGTVDQWPNWMQPLPERLERLVRSKRARDIARALGAGRRGRRSPHQDR